METKIVKNISLEDFALTACKIILQYMDKKMSFLLTRVCE